MFIDTDKFPSNINKLDLIEQYRIYFEYYCNKYKKCTVIMNNGTFYEFYGPNRDTPCDKNIYTMEKVLNLNVSVKENKLMAGFPIVSASRCIPALIDQGWTVVQVDQEETKKEKEKFNRGVTIIHSPGTFIDEFNFDNKYIVYVVIDSFKDPNFDPMAVGISAIDVTTGKIFIYETYNTRDDQNYALDEINRFTQSFRPKEILYKSSITQIETNVKWDPKFEQNKFQRHFLNKIYDLSNAIGTFQIEKYTTAISSFTALLCYCQDHNIQLIQNLEYPKFFENKKYLQLANNAISQLDIINSETEKTSNLFNLVNFTSTPMGHRLLKNRLMFPLKDIDEINSRLDLVEKYSDYNNYIPTLKKIGDLEKMAKDLNKYFFRFISSVRECEKICGLGKEYCFNERIQGKDFINDEILDNLYQKKKKYMAIFNNQKLNWNAEMIIDDKIGCMFKLTNKKYSDIKEDVEILSNNKTFKFCTTSQIKETSIKYLSVSNQISDRISTLTQECIDQIDVKTIKKIIDCIASIDVAVSSAKCADKFNYTRPVIIDKVSFVSVKQLRHPIIERISQAIYVPHDIKLDKKGILLYGFNASGKSSLMKSIGCNIVLAQAGLYVAASRFKFAPFHNILTRIIGTDNMKEGKSSFEVEMSELNGIISRANEYSIILGDEISRGTETESGVALVTAAILEFQEKGGKFLFATHLHQVAKKVENVDIFHLAVERDLKSGRIVYKRELQEGPGDSLYGIEVAKAMGLPDHFITRALAIRKEKSSSYNPDMFLDKCGVCKDTADEVHHIKFQRDANEKGFIGHFHKNHLRNLVGLCCKCHKNLHKGLITINGWLETSDGFKLDYL